MDTNEQLTEQIQAGADGLMGKLWEQLQGFFIKQSGNFYRRHEIACRYAGVEPEDLLQSCFIALYRAVQDYDPGSGYKLTTYLHRHMRNAFAEVCGYRTSKRDPLQLCESLDLPASEEDETTRGEKIPDPAGEETYRQIEEESRRKALRRDLDRCLDSLPEKHKRAIQARYWENKTYQKIGEEMGVNLSYPRALEFDGIRALRRGKSLAILRKYNERLCGYAWRNTGLAAWRNYGASSVERAAEKAEQVLQGRSVSEIRTHIQTQEHTQTPTQ